MNVPLRMLPLVLVLFETPLSLTLTANRNRFNRRINLELRATSLPYQHTRQHFTRDIDSTRFPKASSGEKKDGINTPLINNILRSQAVLCLVATIIASVATRGDLNQALLWGPSPNTVLVHSDNAFALILMGFLAAIPMISLGKVVEESNRRDAHHVNFTTTNMVISLFGRRKIPQSTTFRVFLVSFGLVLITAATEEVLFRGYLSTWLWNVTHGSLLATWFGQATLFGLGHIHPHCRGDENRLVMVLQFTGALWHSIIYTISGSLIPCVICHLLYDWHVLASTWHSVNCQMDYVEQQEHESGWADDLTEFDDILQQDTKAFLARFFYAFDSNRKAKLLEEDVQRAVSYAFGPDGTKAPLPIHVSHAMQERESLNLAEFVRLLLHLRSKQNLM